MIPDNSVSVQHKLRSGYNMRKVVLVSLDAFFGADTERIRPDGFLASMLREGSFCRRVETVFPALTYPIHVTIVTGCDPDKTGVGQNQPLQPGVPKAERVWYWERKHIRVQTLFEAVKQAGGESCSVLWPVNCRNDAVRWCLPEVHPLNGENAVIKVLQYGTPLYILAAQKRFGHLRKGIEEPYLSDFAAAVAADTIRRHQPSFSAIHLIDLDDARHRSGTLSREAMAAMDRNDRRLQDLYRAITETPGMENTLLIAVSDHGQEDIRETVNLTRKLKEYGLDQYLSVQSNGMSACFFPGKMSSGSFDPAGILTPDRLREMGISRLYTREELNDMHAVQGPLFAAEAAEGIAFSDALDEEKRVAATHGFGPGREADLCLFAVFGRGIKKGTEVPAMKMRDVGPTIAGLMGLSLPQAQGTDRSGEFLA